VLAARRKHLLVAVDQVPGASEGLPGRAGLDPGSEVVHPELHDHPFDARLAEDVPLKPREARRPVPLPEQAASADAEV